MLHRLFIFRIPRGVWVETLAEKNKIRLLCWVNTLEEDYLDDVNENMPCNSKIIQKIPPESRLDDNGYFYY